MLCLHPRSTVDAGVGQGTRTLPPSIVSSRQSGSRVGQGRGWSRQGGSRVGQGTSTLTPSIVSSRQSGSRVGRGSTSFGFMDSPTSPRLSQEQASPATPLLDVAPDPPMSNSSLSHPPEKGKQVRRRACGNCEACSAAPCGECTPCRQKYEN